jgi:hypothetical protein
MSTLSIYPPDEPGEQWTVSGDLREIVNLEVNARPGTGDSTNHVVNDKLMTEGWSGANLDSEWSCFFGYTDSEEEAIKLRDEALRLAEAMVAS